MAKKLVRYFVINLFLVGSFGSFIPSVQSTDHRLDFYLMENSPSDTVVNTYVTEQTGTVVHEYDDGHFNTGISPGRMDDGSLYYYDAPNNLTGERMILQDKED